MRRFKLLDSVITRLVGCLVLGGLLISVTLGWMGYRRNESALRMELAQRVALSVRNIQSIVRQGAAADEREDLARMLAVFTSDPAIRAVRVSGQSMALVELGVWPAELDAWSELWPMSQQVVSGGHEIELDRLTLVKSPFLRDGQMHVVEMLVDGPAARRMMTSRILRELYGMWLFMAVMTLLGLLLLRRWFAGPLSQIVQRIDQGVGAEPFARLAKRYRGEFGVLCGAIGQMLHRLDQTTGQLRGRERAFENLYQFAPAAMVSLDPTGKVIEANRRAGELLRATEAGSLIGSPVMQWVRAEDRALLRQTIDKLELDNTARCEMRLNVDKDVIDVVIESTGVRDDDGVLQSVRLSIMDVSPIKKLHNDLTDKSRLLNLIINHMSDAILLVDAEGRIAAYNQQIATLLHVRPEVLGGQQYDCQTFWDELGVLNHDLFVNHMRQIEADRCRPAQERFETRVGAFLFQGIPIDDEDGQAVGRLWVVQEITLQEQSQRLLDQQTSQLQAIKRLGKSLASVGSVDDLLMRAGQLLFELIGVEAVGIALRDDASGVRSRQVLHRGMGAYLLEPNRRLKEAIEQQLMPQVLTNEQVTFWSDLPEKMDWSQAFDHAGLTCLAAAPLQGAADAQGVLWIARRGGERLERHHIYLLEALGPVVAARIEFAQAREQMHAFELTDSVTDLPNETHFVARGRQLENRPGYAWAMMVIRIDNFRKLNGLVDHHDADKVLRQVATALRRFTRKSNFVARLDGPCFGLLCPNVGHDDLQGAADRIGGVVRELSVELPDGGRWALTASIGAVACPADGRVTGELLAVAKDRMQLAKRGGRDRAVCHSTRGDRRVG